MKVLICSDGSKQAQHALQFTRQFLNAGQDKATLFGVVEHHSDQESLAAALRKSQKVIQSDEVEIEVATAFGDPLREIIKKTLESKYDLVVIGAVAKGMRARFAVSTRVFKIVKSVSPPVLVVTGESRKLKRILTCTSGRRLFDQSIPFLSQLAGVTGASVTLFHVLASPPPVFADLELRQQRPEWIDRSRSKVARDLEHERDLLQEMGVSAEIRVTAGSVLREILTEIRRGNYELLAAGSWFSKGPVKTYILGDITRDLIDRAGCPVLVLRTGRRQGVFGRLRRILSS